MSCTYLDATKSLQGSSWIQDCLHDQNCAVFGTFHLSVSDRIWLGWQCQNTGFPAVAQNQEWWVVKAPRDVNFPTVVGHGGDASGNACVGSPQGGWLNNGSLLPPGDYVILWQNHGTASVALHAWVQGAICALPPPNWIGLKGNGATAAIVTWVGVPGASAYAVYKNGQRVGTLNAASAYLQGLSPSTQYAIQVSSINGAGQEGALSAVFRFTTLAAQPSGGCAPSCIPPAVCSNGQCVAPAPGPTKLPAPTGLRVTALGQTTAIIAWASVPGAATYGVYLDGQKVLAQPQADAPAAFLKGMTPGTQHSVAVTAWNGIQGESAQSVPVSFATQAATGSNPCAGVTCPTGQTCVGGTCTATPPGPAGGNVSPLLLVGAAVAVGGAVFLATRHTPHAVSPAPASGPRGQARSRSGGGETYTVEITYRSGDRRPKRYEFRDSRQAERAFEQAVALRDEPESRLPYGEITLWAHGSRSGSSMSPGKYSRKVVVA